MKDNKKLDVMCFVTKTFESIFRGENNPKLLYVSSVRAEVSDYPRIMHAHDNCAEIVLITSGKSEHFIHNKKFSVTSGDLLIYNSGVVHDEISGPNNRIGTYCVAVGGLHMPGLRENALIPDNAGYIFSAGNSFDELRFLMSIMYDNLLERKDYAEEYCTSLMHALLIKVLAITGSAKSSLDNYDDLEILGYRIKEFIDKHYMEPITLQDISVALNISMYYLSHVFKKMSGYSPVRYLLRRRIGEAQTLLVTTNYSISHISEIVGFETQSYFSLQFTKHVGMSPNQYRQGYRANFKNKD